MILTEDLRERAFLRGVHGENENALCLRCAEAEQYAGRYAKLLDGFEQYYGKIDRISVFSAPGRTEIGGNHTDHQHGCVLAASVNLDVIGNRGAGWLRYYPASSPKGSRRTSSI